MTHHPVRPFTRANARRMRHEMTEAELKVWNELRAHRLMGLSFRRQVPIDRYIVDFACPSKKLAVEIDGSQHGRAEHAEADRTRDAALRSLGWTVLRFWNDDVLKTLEDVCRRIVIVAGVDRPTEEKAA